MKGLASLIFLLISALVLTFVILAVAKLTLNQKVPNSETTANPHEIQKQIDQFQKKSIENQLPFE